MHLPYRRLAVLALAVLALAPIVACTPPRPPAVSAPSAGLWISPAEVAALPASGAAWANVRETALDDWGEVDLADNNSTHDTSTLAGALVAVRTGDAALRGRVRAALAEVAATTRFARVLELSRGLPAYVIAADLVGLEPAQERSFRAFLSGVRTRPLEGHSGGDSLLTTALRSPSNWGTMARAAMAAVDLYLGDRKQLGQIATAHRAFLGEAVADPLVYSDTRWHADPRDKAGINRRGTTIAGQSVDGVLPEDQRRTGEPEGRAPQGSYPWEALQGAMVTAVLLDRAGVVPFAAGDDALRRAFTWLSGPNGNPADGDDRWQTWLMNGVRGTSFPTAAQPSPGKNMAWTDWTHAPGSPAAGRRATAPAG
jgi:uncharacterized membrane protein